MLISLSTNGDADTSLLVNKLVKSLLSSGGVALSANLLKVILTKIVDRIKQTQS
jgi:hypothetical protein